MVVSEIVLFKKKKRRSKSMGKKSSVAMRELEAPNLKVAKQ